MKSILIALVAALALGSVVAPASAAPQQFDIAATYAVPGLTNGSPTWLDGKAHIGFAVGPRFGNKIAVVPVVNYLPHYTAGAHDTFRPGILFVYGIHHFDIGFGEILRPVADHTNSGLQAGTTPTAAVATLAFRF